MKGPSVVIPSLPVAGRRSEESLFCFLFAAPFVDPLDKRIFPLDNSRYDD